MLSVDAVQVKGVGSSLLARMYALMAAINSATDWNAPRLTRFSVRSRNQSSTRLSQDELVGESFVGRKFVGLRPMWLKAVGVPDALHRRWADSLVRGHGPAGPLGGVHRARVDCEMNDFRNGFGPDGPLAPAPI